MAAVLTGLLSHKLQKPAVILSPKNSIRLGGVAAAAAAAGAAPCKRPGRGTEMSLERP